MTNQRRDSVRIAMYTMANIVVLLSPEPLLPPAPCRDAPANDCLSVRNGVLPVVGDADEASRGRAPSCSAQRAPRRHPEHPAYDVQDQVVKRVHDAIDDMDAAYLLTLSNQRWATCRRDTVAILAMTTAGLMVVLLLYRVDPSASGLVPFCCLAITQMMQLAVRQLPEVDNAMVSTERRHEYGTELPRESTPGAPAVSDSWPDRGDIGMANVQLRYRLDLLLVLDSLDVSIRGGEKIGVVVGSRAGKSSISTALFRLVELLAGTITIDGLDIAHVPLHELRSRISIIPQDPGLLRRSIWSNLDPLGQHSDLGLWDALHRAGPDDGFHLDAHVEKSPAPTSRRANGSS
ncbi:ABC transporter [Hirsutella rhossiliensis]|uniref:ABC transporter domain-containing protein n=1 Tax=Hirsutella rhossiliensis TaxID=111463 RepID=A0A9P8SP73_9HYPO|nr:ABC transporter domain-containing protein [Hirsutella rhossiliensis]KAH0967911.1 ABC transporter domain-containing protein [Hirsutella rhossiliensis]